MSYRIRYEVRRKPIWKWITLGVCGGVVLWCAVGMAPVWSRIAAGEGLYEALARYVGGMIHGVH